MIATYIGFSSVAFMWIMWIVLPKEEVVEIDKDEDEEKNSEK